MSAARDRSGLWLLGASLLVAAAAIVHDLAALGLDRVGLVERLLSPAGLDAIGALIAALGLFALRLGLVLLAPPILAGLATAWLVKLTHQAIAARRRVAQRT